MYAETLLNHLAPMHIAVTCGNSTESGFTKALSEHTRARFPMFDKPEAVASRRYETISCEYHLRSDLPQFLDRLFRLPSHCVEIKFGKARFRVLDALQRIISHCAGDQRHQSYISLVAGLCYYTQKSFQRKVLEVSLFDTKVDSGNGVSTRTGSELRLFHNSVRCRQLIEYLQFDVFTLVPVCILGLAGHGPDGEIGKNDCYPAAQSGNPFSRAVLVIGAGAHGPAHHVAPVKPQHKYGHQHEAGHKWKVTPRRKTLRVHKDFAHKTPARITAVSYLKFGVAS